MAEVARALEAAVRQRPKDWDAWRVYGDWLAEQGDVRGELVQLEHRLTARGLTADERRALRARIAALKREHQGEWLAGWTPPAHAALDWRHGFVVGVQLRWSADTLRVLDVLVNHPTGRLLTRLNISGAELGDQEARALAASGVLRSVTELDLTVGSIGAGGVRALTRSGALGSLTRLDLAGNDVVDDGARALAEAESLRSLAVLRLQDNHIGSPGAQALAASETLTSLASLSLYANDIDCDGAFALATAQHLRSLARLDLGDNDIGDAGRAALAASKSLRRCRVLV